MKKMTSDTCSQRKIFIYRMVVMAVIALVTMGVVGLLAGATVGNSQADTVTLATADKFAAVGFFSFEEEVVYAPVRGSLRGELPQGARAARGEVVAQLETTATDLTDDDAVIPLEAPCPGLVCYTFDGLEGLAAPDNIEKISVREITSQYQNRDLSEATDISGQGQPLFKIVNNQKSPLLALNIPTNLLMSRAEMDEKWSLTVNGEDVIGELYSCSVEGDTYSLIFKLPPEDKWFAHRFVPVVIRNGK